MDVTLSKYGNNSLTGFLRVFPINKVAFRSKFSSIKASFDSVFRAICENPSVLVENTSHEQ